MEEYQTKYYDKNYKLLKKKRNKTDINRRSNQSTLTDSQIYSKTNEMIEILNKAIKNNEKDKIFEQLERFIINCYYQKRFIQKGGLNYLKEWLINNDKHPIEIDKMINILNNMRFISSYDIDKYNYIHIINHITHNYLLSNNIRKKANKLMMKWIQMKQLSLLRQNNSNTFNK